MVYPQFLGWGGSWANLEGVVSTHLGSLLYSFYLLSPNLQAALCILGLAPIINQEGGIFVSPEVPTPVHGYFPLFPLPGLFPFLCLSFFFFFFKLINCEYFIFIFFHLFLLVGG